MSDLELTAFAVRVLDRMSDASTLMQMKRMNVVAAELDSRVRRAVEDARNRSQTGIPSWGAFSAASEEARDQISTVDQPSDGLQWSWGEDGVEAWPSMDVSLVSLKFFSMMLPSASLLPAGIGGADMRTIDPTTARDTCRVRRIRASLGANGGLDGFRNGRLVQYRATAGSRVMYSQTT